MYIDIGQYKVDVRDLAIGACILVIGGRFLRQRFARYATIDDIPPAV
jgi:hypothetical protein